MTKLTLNRRAIAATALLALLSGCSAGRQLSSNSSLNVSAAKKREQPNTQNITIPVAFVSHNAPSNPSESAREIVSGSDASASLEKLEMLALASNPALKRLAQEYQAARAKARYLDELPDPVLGANIFGHPIETAAGSQRANLAVSQMLPWLSRLDAQGQQACFQAAALVQVYEAEQLKIVAEIRSWFYRLYVLQKHTDISNANQELLESLIDVANSRVATGGASQGDVLAGTLEYSKLEEQLVGLRQQMVAARSQINLLIGRDATTPIAAPSQLVIQLPDWNHTMLRDLAWSNQPDIEAARIRRQASRLGVEVARLQHRPDFTFNASWFAIDDNRPSSSIVDVGKDAWALGAMMTIPIRNKKYAAIAQEALWKHAASHSSIEQMQQRFDALLLDLWEQARAADETARLYQDTIIPEAKRTLAADQEAYTNGGVEFDRVVRDFRNVLTLELGYHRSLGQLATAIARIKQATGTELLKEHSFVLNDQQTDVRVQDSAAAFESNTREVASPPEPGAINN